MFRSTKGADLKDSLKTIVVFFATGSCSSIMFLGIVFFGKIARGPAENYGIMIIAAFLYVGAAVLLAASPFLLVSRKQHQKNLGVGFFSWALPWAIAFFIGLIQNYQLT